MKNGPILVGEPGGGGICSGRRGQEQRLPWGCLEDGGARQDGMEPCRGQAILDGASSLFLKSVMLSYEER